MENSFLFDTDFEVTDELLALLDPVDSPLLSINTLCQNDIDSLISPSSLPPSTSPNCEDVCSFVPFPPISNSEFFSFTPLPESYNASSLHHQPKPLCIEEQQSPLFEQCPLYYPIVDPTLLCDFKAPPKPTLLAAAAVPNGGNKLSAQSVAARERRKRISEKTKELGRLVPSGYKMNTTEMLKAALKYVKFLQAQLAVLHHRDSIPGYKNEGEEHLAVLLGSQAIQGRLAAEGLCIMPKQVVDE